jgi:NAD-dependent histone deacetylase SIR2
VADDEGPITSVYLNLDFPVPTRDWEGVFDVWLKGDAQQFATAIKAELEKADAAKEATLERKRKREEAAAEAAALAALGEVQVEPPPKKRKLSKKKPSKPPTLSTSTPPPTNSQFTLKTKATPVSTNLTRINRLPSPSDEESDSSQREKIYLKIPGLGSRSQSHTPPAPSWPRQQVEVVIERRPQLVYSSPNHGQKAIQSQADLKGVFQVTMGKPTAKLK